MEILSALRQATDSLHTQIEQLPLSQAMLAGQVARDQYVSLLKSLYHVHAAAEERLATTPVVAAVWPPTPSRAAAVIRDLAAFGVEPGDAPESVGEWVSQIDAVGHPAAWAGVGYVLEGSRLGSRVLARPLARSLSVEPRLGVGLDYHLDTGPDPIGTWRQVQNALSGLDNSSDARAAMIAAAGITFKILFLLHETTSELALQTAG
jgi:heme oxygenase